MASLYDSVTLQVLSFPKAPPSKLGFQRKDLGVIAIQRTAGDRSFTLWDLGTVRRWCQGSEGKPSLSLGSRKPFVSLGYNYVLDNPAHTSLSVWSTWIPLSVFFKKRFIYLFCIRVHGYCLQTHHKRASDPITDGCEPPCGCWELNSGTSRRAVSSLNHWAISPAPRLCVPKWVA